MREAQRMCHLAEPRALQHEISTYIYIYKIIIDN